MEKSLYFFVSDVHLGLDHKDPVARERKFASFLAGLPQNTKAVYLLGDIFDFWYEYRNVIPRGYTRTLGALASLVDRGVEVYFFNGNHDIWTYNYFASELGLKMMQQPYVVEIEGKNSVWDMEMVWGRVILGINCSTGVSRTGSFSGCSAEYIPVGHSGWPTSGAGTTDWPTKTTLGSGGERMRGL